MIKKLHFKLAIDGIKKNVRLYAPYCIVSSFMVFVFFIINNLIESEVLIKLYGGEVVSATLAFGVYVIAIFSLIFLSYTAQFIYKNRVGEYGLLSILGLSKKDLLIINIIESIIISIINIILGMLLGMFLGKVFILLVGKAFKSEEILTYLVTYKGVINTFKVYLIIFGLVILGNIWEMRKFNPINLLNESRGGQKEPKSRFLLALAGVLTLGAGYFLAQIVKDPIDALTLFFIAVILVIIGTFLLFSYFSTVFLKGVRRNKKLYYTKKRFIYISSLIYRIKQNAMSLASICILCTMVLVTVVSTVSMYVGKDEISDKITPGDINIMYRNYEGISEKESILKRDELLNNLANENNVKLTKVDADTNLTVKGNIDENNNFEILPLQGERDQVYQFLDLNFYNKYIGQDTTLEKGEIAYYSNNQDFIGDELSIQGKKYKMKFSEELNMVFFGKDISKGIFLFNSLDEIIENLPIKDVKLLQQTSYDVQGSSEDILKFRGLLSETSRGENSEELLGGTDLHVLYKDENKREIDSLYGGLLVLGGFLGIVFIVSAIMVMYYKQVSEGMEDKKRFTIMKNVGMTNKEIKDTIREQTNTIFYLPVAFAIIHLAFAYNMITKILLAMNFNNKILFLKCTFITTLIFVIVYTIVYKITSTSYYKIVSE